MSNANLFGDLNNDGLEESKDRLGGFAALETDIYTGPIKMAYAGQSLAGARNVTLILEHETGKEYRETVYITNKKGENFFLNKDDNTKKVPLPGFTTIDDICLVATGKPLCEQVGEDKMVKVYDPDQQKELPKSVPVLVDLLGKIVSVAITKTLENKNVKSGNEYVPTAETRQTNHIDKVFDTDSKLTVAEARQGASVATFWHAWLERNKGKEQDKRTIKDGVGGAPGRPGVKPQSGPPQAAGQAPARKSLFGAK